MVPIMNLRVVLVGLLGTPAIVHYAAKAVTTPGGEPVAQGDSQAGLIFDGTPWWVVADMR
ncbi:hypothetical protein AB0F91_34750 [Amycolatopsis sp. NPDC023774]|uniref:hypothetical protein n=1 Tax=Amycolatopsis sp. NPDC023774 TaxID=3155015 RepID=UPI0033F3AE39